MKTLLLIDANALIHRSFYALPPLSTSDGQPIGAVYGLASTLLKILRDYSPDYIAACFDRPEPTFRKEMFKDYKVHRPPAVEELISQIIKSHELFEKFNIPIFEKSGYEADDIIGTLVKIFKDYKDLKIIILTGDLDTLQLIQNDRIVVQTFKKGVSDITTYNEQAVINRYGLKPSQLPDYKGLVGDVSDNIPGVKGLGPKTAEKVLAQYQNLENLFEQLEKETENPLAKKLLPLKEQVFFSKKLATIETNVPLEEINLEKIAYHGLPQREITEYFAKLGFQSLIDRIFKTRIQLLPKTSPATEPLAESLIAKTEPELIIAGWLIDPDQKDFSLAALGRRFLHKENFSPQELIYFINKKLNEYGLRNLFENIELPLIPILTTMTNTGIKVNLVKLKKLDREAEKELKDLTKKIFKAVGTTFNINSPKQLAEILFQKLGLTPPRPRKTEVGRRSTAEQVLFEIKNEHPVVNLILNYRETFKIKSTYLEPLQKMLGKDGRIHTRFIQTGTATGRLSSEKPNLQNIPRASKWAGPLRDAFEAPDHWSFLSLDYSQMELRILAEETGEPKLKEAFWKNQDIHQLTASQIFNIDFEKVSPEMRRIGKTLNFSIIYGMGAAALAQQTNLTKTEAQEFIKEYFNDFPKIKIWQEKTKEEARTMGFVKNANGRRRWFLQLLSNSSRAQAEAERAAINMPIQSLGADIIKLAMIKTTELIKEKKWQDKAKLILSIHDELLFEIKDDILKTAAVLLKETMEKVYSLSIPLVVEVKYGKTWGNLKLFSKN